MGAGLSEVDVQQVDLTFRAGDPDTVAPMMMQGAAAVLPEFMALAPEERQAKIGRMKADLADALSPFIRGGELVADTAANVLTARR